MHCGRRSETQSSPSLPFSPIHHLLSTNDKSLLSSPSYTPPPHHVTRCPCQLPHRPLRNILAPGTFAAKARASRQAPEPKPMSEAEDNFASSGVVAPVEGTSQPLADVLRELGKRVPDSLVKTCVEDNGYALRRIVNSILNVHAAGKFMVVV